MSLSGDMSATFATKLAVRLILAIAKIHNLDSKAINFVLAFPQVDLEEDIWMQLPIGF